MKHRYSFLRLFIRTLLLVTLSVVQFAFAQPAIRWINPMEVSPSLIGGRGWPADSIVRYRRLPKHTEGQVSETVWALARQSAGVSIDFRTPAQSIDVRYQVSNPLSMPHMPATGVSGLDLYAVDQDGGWHRVTGTYHFGDTIRYTFSGLNKPVGAYRLYLPLYNEVKWLEIGIPDSVQLTPVPHLGQRPLVVYGTSIAQGGCASRPGLAWPSLLERQMDRPVINLGFSGNGLLEPNVIDEIVTLDAAAYILDCIPNIFPLADTTLENRLNYAIHRIRSAHPAIPIILVEDASPQQQFTNDFDGGARTHANAVLTSSVDALKAEGIGGLYILSDTDIGFTDAATVDGVHPGDLGMALYADAYERILRKVLNEPVGILRTTRPTRQYRELHYYDWSERQDSLLKRNQQDPPKRVILGNSIVHYWGGEPAQWPNRGSQSWARYLVPNQVRNLGFGWDRIENVLWRVYQGALDGYEAIDVVIMIGTNNLQVNTDEEITAGLAHLIRAVKQRQPSAHVTLCGLLPRENMEPRIAALNPLIAQVAEQENVDYLNIGEGFLTPSGMIDASLFVDGLHPNEAGYEKIAKKIAPTFRKDK